MAARITAKPNPITTKIFTDFVTSIEFNFRDSRLPKTGQMIERYFDDLRCGERLQSAEYIVTEEEIINFAREFDPQPFHLDAAVADKTIFGGLIASGWHTAAITMRLFVKTLNFAEGAIGLGVDELRWPNAVKPNDVLQVETEIVDLRESRSKPSHGIVRIRNITTNQRGEIVQTMFASALVSRRVIGLHDQVGIS
jgi:acyl dehydratase